MHFALAESKGFKTWKKYFRGACLFAYLRDFMRSTGSAVLYWGITWKYIITVWTQYLFKGFGHTRRKFFSISESRNMAWIPFVTACIFHEPRHHARMNTPVNTAVIWYCLYRNMYILYSVCILVFFVAYESITCASIEMLSSDIIFRSTSTL